MKKTKFEKQKIKIGIADINYFIRIGDLFLYTEIKGDGNSVGDAIVRGL